MSCINKLRGLTIHSVFQPVNSLCTHPSHLKYWKHSSSLRSSAYFPLLKKNVQSSSVGSFTLLALINSSSDLSDFNVISQSESVLFSYNIFLLVAALPLCLSCLSIFLPFSFPITFSCCFSTIIQQGKLEIISILYYQTFSSCRNMRNVKQCRN